MKSVSFAVAAVSVVGMFAGVALADTATNSTNSGAQLSQSECTNLWQEANPTGAATLSQSQSAPYIADFKAANPDGDGSIDLNEWNSACQKGLVKSTSSSGASSGQSGANDAGTSSHQPGQQQQQ
jgi:hypothetical protein